VCYCSKQCQKGDWKVHKLECKETPSKGICDKEVRQVQLDARPGADLRSADVEDEVLGAESAVGGAAAWQGDEHDQTSEAGHAAVAPDLSAALDLSSKKQDLCLTARAREGNSDGVPTKKKRRKPKKKTGADDDDVSVQQEDAAEIAKARQQKLDLEEKAAWAFQEETRKSVLAERTFECNIEYLVRQCRIGQKGISVLIRGMKAHDTNSRIQKKTLQALHSLFHHTKGVIVRGNLKTLSTVARNDAVKVEFARQGGIAVVITVLKTHGDNAKVQKHGCGALWQLAFRNPANQVDIARQGGIDVVLNALQNHRDDANVQEQGCGALWNLGVDDTNKVKIAKQGGIALVLQALGNHRNNANIHEKTCVVLECPETLAIDDNNRVEIASKGGIDAVISALMQHEDNANVQEKGCGALVNLSANDSNRIEIAKRDGIDVVIKAMLNNRRNAQVQGEGCKLLRNLACQGSTDLDPALPLSATRTKLHADLIFNRVEIARKGGIDAIIKALVNHPKNRLIMGEGMMALMQLSYTSPAADGTRSKTALWLEIQEASAENGWTLFSLIESSYNNSLEIDKVGTDNGCRGGSTEKKQLAKLLDNKYLLLDAASGGDTATVSRLLQQLLSTPGGQSFININCQNEHGYTPLFIAAAKGHASVTKQLIAARCNINCPNAHGNTPLQIAAQEGHTAITEQLIAARCDVDLRSKHGLTALHSAAQDGHAAVTEQLIAAGCNVDLQDGK
jgi:hypothetical protein